MYKTLTILEVTFMAGTPDNCGFKINNRYAGNEIKVPYDNGGHFRNSVEKAAWVLEQQGFNIIGICGDKIITDTHKEMLPHNYQSIFKP